MATNVQVIYGQGGKGLLSSGFIRLARRIRSLGYDVDDSILWSHPFNIAERIRARKEPTCIFGYSMGGNSATWVAEYQVPIPLIVSYDASVGIGPVKAKPPSVIAPNVKRTIAFQGVGPRIAGGAVITGHNVETIETRMPHLAVCSDERLHAIALLALRDVPP